MEYAPSLLVLARHSESVRNKAKKGNIYFPDEEARQYVVGIPDDKIEITAHGIWQSEKTGPEIRERFGVFDYVYHTGFTRTIQTMEGMLKAYTAEERKLMKIRMNQFIYERHSGYAYDMTTEEAEAAFPWLKEYWRTFGGFFAQPPGGESIAQMVARVNNFIIELNEKRKGKKVLVFLHGGTIRCIRFILEHWTFDQAKSWPKGQAPENCGVTTYVYSPTSERLELEEYNKVYWK